ncbi:MAG: ATP-binding protein [Bacteroidales bacterium]|nr:ATP-binding protein [Bacteroidales bacterium]
MIPRETYFKQLSGYMDKPFIKVITGLRRCGKSVLLMMLRDEFLKKGVNENNILYINLESFEYSEMDDASKLYQYIQSKITNKQRYYILLDEIQEVRSWEKVVNSLCVDFDSDVYITGSNSRLLSSELATYLAGRYVEIPIFTLSFTEYLLFRQEYAPVESVDIYREFDLFLRKGGFPAIHAGHYSEELAYKAVYDIYSSAILRDTVQRYNIRDLELLERVVKFVFDNVGNKFSAKNVADYFKSQNRKIDLNTVYNYLHALEGAFIIYRIPRYDIKGKEILKTNEKYYVGDQSLLYAVMGFKDRLISGVLENIVMLELKRKGYRVFVGKSDEKEIDFIAEKAEEKIYIQVSYKMTEKSTIDREFSPLLGIKDNYPKYVVTMDETWHDNIEGIQHKHMADFLLMKTY